MSLFLYSRQKKRCSCCLRVSVLSAVCLSAGHAFADDLSLQLGLGAAYQSSYVLGEDDVMTAVPFFAMEYGPWSLSTDGLAFTLPISLVRSVSIGLSGRSAPYDLTRNDRLSNLEERDDAADLSLTLSEWSPYGTLSGRLSADISGVYSGYEAALSFVIEEEWLEGMAALEMGVSYQSSELVQHYYSVSGSEASLDIPEYHADATMVSDISLSYSYPWTPHLASIAMLGFSHYGAGISDSPITDKSYSTNAVLGLIYEF